MFSGQGFFLQKMFLSSVLVGFDHFICERKYVQYRYLSFLKKFKKNISVQLSIDTWKWRSTSESLFETLVQCWQGNQRWPKSNDLMFFTRGVFLCKEGWGVFWFYGWCLCMILLFSIILKHLLFSLKEQLRWLFAADFHGYFLPCFYIVHLSLTVWMNTL